MVAQPPDTVAQLQALAAAVGEKIDADTAARVAALYEADAAAQLRILAVFARNRVQTLAEWTKENYGFG